MDILGNEIEIGSRIVYPVRNGATVRMQTGAVEKMVCHCGTELNFREFRPCYGQHPVSAKVRKASGKLVTLTSFDNVVVVK